MFQSFETVADSRSSVSRLASLRAALAGAGFDAFLVPRTDAHQGETVAPCDERLAWLTGFTGSAGAALVTADRAALFVDGRYTLQAAAESDAAAFEVVASQRVTPSAWLIETLGAEAAAALRLGFDPMLHGRAEIDRLAEALGRRPEPLSPNPIDALWEDRPPRPAGAIAVHPESLAGEAAGAKRSRLGKALAEGGSDAALLTLPDSIAWLLNIRGSDLVHSPVSQGFAILEADGRVTLFTEPEKIDGAVAAHLGNAVTVAAPDTLLPALAGLSGRKVLVDRASCPLAFTAALEEAGAGLVWGADPCIAAKAIKTEAELAGIRAAHIRDGAAFVRFLHWLETALAAGEPLTEIAIASTLERFRHETGALLDIAFDTICGSGPNGAIVHYRVNRATDRTLQPGEILLVDSGGQYRDGTTDITRTLATGPADAEAARAFTLVLKGMIAISRARWPEGLTGRDLDPLARAALWRAGLDYDHGTGHGVGAYLNVHEGPHSLSRRGGGVAFEPGMVVSNEPGCYRPGHWGIRIENLVAVTPPSVPEGGERAMLGFETLTLAPIDRRLVRPALLDGEERAWLDAYHARVAQTLAPALAGHPEAAAWLNAACAPLEPAA